MGVVNSAAHGVTRVPASQAASLPSLPLIGAELSQEKKKSIPNRFLIIHASKSQWSVDYFVKELDRKALALLYSDTTTVLEEYGITE